MAQRIPFLQARARQPEVLGRVQQALSVRLTEPLFGDSPGHVAFVGMGASHAAAAVAVQRLLGAGTSASRQLASDRPVDAPWPRGTVVVGISQSGRSPETAGILAAARAAGAVATVALTNEADTPLSRAADVALDFGNQPDSFASTIGYTATVLGLDLLAAALTGESGQRSRSAADDQWTLLIDGLASVQQKIAIDVSTLLAALSESASIDVVGAGASLAAAEVTALLLREVSRIPATAAETRNYLHGAMESAGRTGHIIFGRGRERSLAGMLGETGHRTVLVAQRRNDDAFAADLPGVSRIELPDLPPAPLAVVEAVFAQTLVAGLAECRGLDIEHFVFHNDDTKIGQTVPPMESLGETG